MNGNALDPDITIPTDASQVTINADGAVVTTNAAGAQQQAGQISLYTFPNPGGLEAIGSNLLTQTAASGEPTTSVPGQNGTGTLAQGFLEGSNVTAVDEMVAMISTQRAYELNTNVIKTADQMLQKITNLR